MLQTIIILLSITHFSSNILLTKLWFRLFQALDVDLHDTSHFSERHLQSTKNVILYTVEKRHLFWFSNTDCNFRICVITKREKIIKIQCIPGTAGRQILHYHREIHSYLKQNKCVFSFLIRTPQTLNVCISTGSSSYVGYNMDVQSDTSTRKRT